MADLKGSAKLGEYLRSLRAGYGFSLRKVEEKARQLGGDVDNSQLSRYEKGICYPSFDKLRTLSRIFNVSIQAFSDVVDLEELEQNLPAGDDAAQLLEAGRQEAELGDYARAYSYCHKARLVDQPREGAEGLENGRQAAKARLAAAICLERMGKLSLAEHELRQLLRLEPQLDDGLVLRALLELCNVHSSFGDYLLAEMEARRALALAEKTGEQARIAGAHLNLGRIHNWRGEEEQALEQFHQALSGFRDLGDVHSALRVKLLLGPLYAARGQFREAVRLLKETRDEARTVGQRWTVACAGAWLAEVHFRHGDHQAARVYMRESNTIASSGDAQYTDILFLNAYYLWKMAQQEGNAAEMRIALGRLKHLRPHLETNLAEVRDFDRYIERGGAQ